MTQPFRKGRCLWMKNNTLPLSDLAPGEQGIVAELEGGTGFLGRMAALGFTPGATVSVMRNHRHGPIIVSVLETQIALGRGQASKVYVRRGS